MGRRKKYILFYLAWLFFAAPLLAGPAGQSQQSIRDLIQKAERKKTRFSIHFCDPATGESIFAHQSDRALIPASNMKLITSAAALDQLGADFEYETIFGLWKGNLVVVAGGDPLLGGPTSARDKDGDLYSLFDQILQQLRKRQVAVLGGNLLIDDTIFDDERFHPSWPIEQADKWYAAQVSALNFNNNCIDVTFAPAGQAGQPALYAIRPETRYATIINHCKTVSRGASTVGASREHGSNNITLRGKCRKAITKPIHVTVDRPSAYFGFVLAEYLLSKGVTITGNLVIRDLGWACSEISKDMDLLLAHRSSIKEVLKGCNRSSRNLVAECLFKTLGVYHQVPSGGSRVPGSWNSGRAAVAAFLKKLKVNPDQYTIDDGSGLSHENRLSAGCITKVLAYMYNHPAGELYRNSLSTGRNGTLARRSRFSHARYRDRIFAKTGYVAGVRALSGYCQTANGRWLAFAILSNSPPANTRTIDQIVKEMMK